VRDQLTDPQFNLVGNDAISIFDPLADEVGFVWSQAHDRATAPNAVTGFPAQSAY
jgi:hypothetical protein